MFVKRLCNTRVLRFVVVEIFTYPKRQLIKITSELTLVFSRGTTKIVIISTTKEGFGIRELLQTRGTVVTSVPLPIPLWSFGSEEMEVPWGERVLRK